MAVPSIFIVAPIGIVNDLVVFPTPSSSNISIDAGTEALLDDVEKVMAATFVNFFKNGIIFCFINILNKPL